LARKKQEALRVANETQPRCARGISSDPSNKGSNNGIDKVKEWGNVVVTVTIKYII
jgi:hypothetical protein